MNNISWKVFDSLVDRKLNCLRYSPEKSKQFSILFVTTSSASPRQPLVRAPNPGLPGLGFLDKARLSYMFKPTAVSATTLWKPQTLVGLP